MEELAEFLSFDFNVRPIPKYQEDWRLDDPVDAVLSTCSTLLSVVDVNNSAVVQYSHFSVKEFLTSSRFTERCDTISRRYHISMAPAHTVVAQACLGILLHLDKSITRDNLQKFPLARYAAEFWVGHALFEGVSQNMEEGMKRLFDLSKPHFSVWLWIYDPYPSWIWAGRVEKPFLPRGTPLHYAAFYGLHPIVEFLAIDHSQDANSRSFDNESTPLHLASQRGHVEVASLLVKHGADVIARDKSGSTPLHEALGSGSMEVARLLSSTAQIRQR